MIVERGEEGHSQTAVRHGIQETMAGGRQKEVNPHREAVQAGRCPAKCRQRHGARQESGEEKRVGEAAVAPEVAIMDAESKSDHVKIGNHGAGHARDPNSLWRAWAVETGPYA